MLNAVTYLRREPTTDETTHKYAPHLLSKAQDVQSYCDPEAKEKGMARWPWHYSKSKPTRRNRYVTLGCVRHRVVWLPDLQA
jgi:hypothetical protein